jgi:branched-chain amino acid transport system substrate-binding protein
MRFVGKAVRRCLVAGTVVAVAGCGSGGTTTSTRTGTTPGNLHSRIVDIYSSLPLQGPLAVQGQAIVKGIELALSQAGGRAGTWTINYQSMNDATAGQRAWDPSATGDNARRVAEDPKAVYYVGEFSSLASEVSLPILNQAKVPQVSPANTYMGLTTTAPGSGSQEPASPSGVRSYLRLVPNDSVQAAADLEAMKEAGCRKVAVATSSGDAYGAEFTSLFATDKGAYDVTIVGTSALDLSSDDFHGYTGGLKSHGVDCVFLAASASPPAVTLTEAIDGAVPKVKLFGPDQMCVGAWTDPKLGGVPDSIARRIECTMPVLSIDSYPGGRRFQAAYKAKYGDADPNPYAIYGYEAMKLGLHTIASLGPAGNDKLAVLKALFDDRRRNSVLGSYGFDRNGDTTLRSYGLYRIGSNGEPQFYKTLTPPTS